MDFLSTSWVRHKRKKEIPPVEETTPVEYQGNKGLAPLWLAAGSLGMLAIVLRLLTSKSSRQFGKRRRNK